MVTSESDPYADAGNGTPEGRRILELLWEPAGAAARGPRPKLTLDQILEAGVAQADADGLAALSMRGVAQRLGVGTMSLYTYVPGRSELIELMVDRVYADLHPGEPGDTWRGDVERLARQRWELFRRHPWLLDLNLARLPLGPHVLDVEEAGYAAVARTGLVGADVVALSNLITWQVVGAARAQIVDADEERRSGTSAEAYWLSRASFWSSYFTAERFPTMNAIWSVGGFDDESAHSFERTVRELLDAVELVLARRAR